MKTLIFLNRLFCPVKLLLLLLACGLISVSQAADSTYYFRTYMIHTTGAFGQGGTIAVFKNSTLVSQKTFESGFESLSIIDFNNDNSPKIVARLYSGGAHCCFSIAIMDIINDTLSLICTKDLMNSDFQIKDLDKDGRQEIVTYDDRFAYEFTSFADSRFYIAIYHFENNQLIPQNKLFRDFVLKDVEQLKIEFEKLMQDGYAADKGEKASTSNHLPQAQAILSAITGNYYSLGDDRKGFALIDRMYIGGDKEQFTAYLKMKLSSNNSLPYSEFLKLNK